MDNKPGTWEERLTLYVGYLVSINKQSCTIRSYVSAIKAILSDIGIELNENRCLLNSLTRACKLVNDKVRTRLPIKKSLLNCILLQVQKHYVTQPYQMALYMALFSTAYFGLFRVGELTASKHVVKAVNVRIGQNKNKILFILDSSKTHGCNTLPQRFKISSTVLNKEPVKKGQAQFCPFQLIRHYLGWRGEARTCDEQFFMH